MASSNNGDRATSPAPPERLRRDSSDSGRKRLHTSSISWNCPLTIAMAAGSAAGSSTTTVLVVPIEGKESRLSKAWRGSKRKPGVGAARGRRRVPATGGAAPSRLRTVGSRHGGRPSGPRVAPSEPGRRRPGPLAGSAPEAPCRRRTIPPGWRRATSGRVRPPGRRRWRSGRPGWRGRGSLPRDAVPSVVPRFARLGRLGIGRGRLRRRIVDVDHLVHRLHGREERVRPDLRLGAGREDHAQHGRDARYGDREQRRQGARADREDEEPHGPVLAGFPIPWSRFHRPADRESPKYHPSSCSGRAQAGSGPYEWKTRELARVRTSGFGNEPLIANLRPASPGATRHEGVRVSFLTGMLATLNS